MDGRVVVCVPCKALGRRAKRVLDSVVQRVDNKKKHKADFLIPQVGVNFPKIWHKYGIFLHKYSIFSLNFANI